MFKRVSLFLAFLENDNKKTIFYCLLSIILQELFMYLRIKKIWS